MHNYWNESFNDIWHANYNYEYNDLQFYDILKISGFK